MKQLPGHDRGPVRPGRVEARIDGRPVEAVIVGDPWAEAARAFQRLGEALADAGFIAEPKGRRRE